MTLLHRGRSRWMSTESIPSILVGLVIVVASARPAAACDCASASAETALSAADVVFVGRVVAIRIGQRYAWPEVEFGVDERLKGELERPNVILHTVIGRGTNCEGFPFEVGERYVVFAATRHSVTGWPKTYGVNWCMGTSRLDAAGRRMLSETRIILRHRRG